MDLFQMDFFIYILILMLIVGAFFVFYGAFSRKEAGAAMQQQNEGNEMLSLAKKLDTLETSVVEADEAVHMLDDMSKNVFKEFDSKYQELLFLYNLVDEKQKTLALTGDTNASPAQAKNTKSVTVVVPDVMFPAAGPSATKAQPKRKTATVTRPVAMPQVVAEVETIASSSLDVTVDDSTNSQNHGINPKFANVLRLSQ